MADFALQTENITQARSRIACHICRKRKIKCGRELPHCLLCKQSQQQCEYPDKVLRPGPKIGSTQVPRKRGRQNEPDREQQSQSRRRSSSSVQRDSSQPYNSWPTPPPQQSPNSQPLERRTSNVQSLSFILHPSHESCSPEKLNEETVINRQNHGESHLASACYSLGLLPETLDNIIDRFFETFTSFRLFRQSDFHITLSQIETLAQCKALLAAILLFAMKVQDEDSADYPSIDLPRGASSTSQALAYVDEAIHECEDAPIPLPLLQALILVTQWLLIQGVRGRAWRYLGLAVRIAYELNLHLIDAGTGDDGLIDSSKWCHDEERRRAWWAIWEMDVFASVIRRCPTAINWSQNETFLLAEDEKWFRGEPQASCRLETDALKRYRALEATGNQSWKAWFIVINSLMKDAQKVTSPFGVDRSTATTSRQDPTSSTGPSSLDRVLCPPIECTKESLNHLSTIQNALQCTTMALPQSLKYRTQNLGFGCKELDRHNAASLRYRHSSIYSIHVMVQLTKLMLYKYHLFRTGIDKLAQPNPSPRNNSEAYHSAEIQALEEYTEASDEIVSIIGRSHEDHYKYVNPFLANTIWLAGAVQLLYRELAPLDPSEKSLANSKVELLSMTYKRFVSYWNMSTPLQKNLEIVESEIRNFRFEARRSDPDHCTTVTKKRPSVARRRSSKRGRSGPRSNAVGPNDPCTTSTLLDSGISMPSHTAALNNVVSPASYDSEGAIQQSNETGEGPSPIWPPITDDSTDHHGDLMNFNAADPRLFSSAMNYQQSQNQQLPYSRNCSNDGQFLDANSAIQQVPGMLRSIPNNSMQQQNSQYQLFGNGNTQSGLSPDFLAGVSFGSKHCLSNYLGEMLSGGYMT